MTRRRRTYVIPQAFVLHQTWTGEEVLYPIVGTVDAADKRISQLVGCGHRVFNSGVTYQIHMSSRGTSTRLLSPAEMIEMNKIRRVG